MQIVALKENRCVSGLEDRQPLAIACGYFDTVHLGHRQLIAKAVDSGYIPCVMTFDDKFYTALGLDCKPIYDYQTRRELLLELGVRYLLVLDSTDGTMQRPGDEFVDELLSRLPVGLIVCGSDFRYGKKAAWDATALQKQAHLHGVNACVLPLLCDGTGNKYSTGTIRRALQNGDIEGANRALGSPYKMHGVVLHGRGLGHTIGYATANFAIDDKLTCPKMGVYAIKTIIDGRTYAGICNVGAHPTVADMRCNVETHIVGYNGDLYDKDLTIYLGKYLRDICKFEDVNTLCAQLEKDCREAVQWMEKYD